jgi:nifR3 family TIM-barrel protein
MINFWQSQFSLFMLAPMEDVTDTVFRQIVLENANSNQLHLLFTEFVSTDGLCHPIGYQNVIHRLKICESERQLLKQKNVKIIAQIWGNNPDKFAKAIRLIEDNFDFDGIDINMGCPVRNVVAHGSCSALIDQPELAKQIIEAARASTQKPLSVKTRLGVKKIDTERWMITLLNSPLDAIILHGRIQKQMSDGEANWDEIAKAVELRNSLNINIKIIGNGDILSMDEANIRVNQTGVDGVMIGRGIFKNPWLFQLPDNEIDTNIKITTLLRHLNLFKSVWGDQKNFAILRRFFKIYLSGFEGASELRHQIMMTTTFEDAKTVVKNFTQTQLITI